MESVERDIEAIEDGHLVTPEAFGNLMLMVRMGTMAYLRDRDLGAPEEILESLRQYVVQAIAILNIKNGGAANANAGGMPSPDMMPPEMPAAGAPSSALSPQAMQLVAS
jgi:hypothetical protein